MPTGHSTPSIPVSQCLKLVDATSKTCPIQPPTVSATTEIPGKDFADTAIGVVNTVNLTATYLMGGMALLLALAAFIGWQVIVRSAKGHAERVANARWKEYIKSQEFTDLIKVSVDESVERRWQDKFVAQALTEEPRADDDPAPFDEGGETDGDFGKK